MQFVAAFLARVEDIREKLEEFDRELSDYIRPLALFFDGFDVDGKGTFEQKNPGDPLSNNFVFQQVDDKICQMNLNGSQRKKEAEDKLKVLHETLNLIQIQFKRNILVLQDIDQQIQDYLFVFLEENHDKFSDKEHPNQPLFKQLMGLIELCRDSLAQKKTNLLGCKMKIYQERMRQIQFLEILTRY